MPWRDVIPVAGDRLCPGRKTVTRQGPERHRLVVALVDVVGLRQRRFGLEGWWAGDQGSTLVAFYRKERARKGQAWVENLEAGRRRQAVRGGGRAICRRCNNFSTMPPWIPGMPGEDGVDGVQLMTLHSPGPGFPWCSWWEWRTCSPTACPWRPGRLEEERRLCYVVLPAPWKGGRL